ncbi:MAG: hypothetical protein K8I00_08375 [Candidatus Omnitrophica bacterium]|nr:hypothetical protein [Candidatus Omnitrophota bacterium]
MKIDKALQEVWDWKNAIYERTKHMSFEERMAYRKKRAEDIKKKYNLRLRTVEAKHQ